MLHVLVVKGDGESNRGMRIQVLMANDRALNELARLLKRTDRGSQIAQELSGKMQPTYGKIVDVDDPERRGRVKVILDTANPDFLTADGYDQGESKPTQTDWISPQVPFKGVQPEKMVGLRVPIKARDGDSKPSQFWHAYLRP